MWIVINLLLMLLNGFLAWYNYDNESYGKAIINSFACGFAAALVVVTVSI